MVKKNASKFSELISRKIIGNILNDLSLFGSLPFYIFVTLMFYFIGNQELFSRLTYCFLISIIVILVVKNVHYKDRPQKEEFNIFMEKVIASSFPSTHSLNVTILTILLIMSYPFKWLIWTLCIVAFSVFVQRYMAKKHFVIDIIGGILIGIVEVIFVVKVL